MTGDFGEDQVPNMPEFMNNPDPQPENTGNGSVEAPRPRIHNRKMLAAIHAVIVEHSGNGLLADEVVRYISVPQPENTVPAGQTELLPCPFCARMPQWMPKTNYGRTRYWIACHCGLELATAWIDKADAAKIWNRRGVGERVTGETPSVSSRPRSEDASGSTQEPNIGGDCDHGFPAGHNCPHCEPSTSQKGEVVGQPSLSEVLKEIEEHAKGCGGRGYYVVPNRTTGEPEQEQCRMCYEQPDMQERLVKALRRASDWIDDNARSLDCRNEIMSEITSILTSAGDKKKDLETKPQSRQN